MASRRLLRNNDVDDDKKDTTTLVISPYKSFPELTFYGFNGEWYIPAVELKGMVFRNTVMNRECYKTFRTSNLSPGAKDMLSLVRSEKIGTKLGRIGTAFTLESFIELMRKLPVKDSAWKVRQSRSGIEAYIDHIRKTQYSSPTGRRVSPPRKSAFSSFSSSSSSSSSSSMGLRKRKITQAYNNEEEEEEEEDAEEEEEEDQKTPITGDVFAAIVKSAFDEKIKEEAVARYMMMPEIEERAKQILVEHQAKLEEDARVIREKTMELSLTEMDKAIKEHVETRRPQLEIELKEQVIMQLSQRPDIVERARQVALINTRVQRDLPSRKKQKTKKIVANQDDDDSGDNAVVYLSRQQLEPPQAASKDDFHSHFKKPQ